MITAKNGKASKLLGQINKALEEVVALPETREAWKKDVGSVVYKPWIGFLAVSKNHAAGAVVF